MSRWIDADAFLKEYCEPYPHIYKAMSRAMAEAPSIDIVRCGECKYWKSTVQMPNGTEVKCLYGRKADDFCSYGSRDSEKPNNCEHITEDGVTCAKYPACDDCLDNPLNKVKGAERLVKGSEKPNSSTISKKVRKSRTVQLFPKWNKLIRTQMSVARTSRSCRKFRTTRKGVAND